VAGRENRRETFSSGLGFILAAAGSAVGLGNMWRFSYMAAEGGGAAFVLLYFLMTLIIGVPVMMCEFAIGRHTRQSPPGALSQLGDKTGGLAGILLVITPTIILAYFSVIAGWTLRYLINAFSGFDATPFDTFNSVSGGMSSLSTHLAIIAVTMLIVMSGVHKGIERMALILMPALFVILIGLAVWATTLPDAEAGYAFYLKPDWSALGDPTVFRQAASQAFLSLSVGMGVMITYASYLSSRTGLVRSAFITSMTDFSVAFLSGMVVFPIIFAFGLQSDIGDSTIGTLFISLPAAFQQLGDWGQPIGIVFFVALVVAGITSLVSLMEVGTASVMDKFGLSRRNATLSTMAVAALIGVYPALSKDVLGTLDKIVGELFVTLGALLVVLLAGRKMKNLAIELSTGEKGLGLTLGPLFLWLIRWVAPIFLIVTLVTLIGGLVVGVLMS